MSSSRMPTIRESLLAVSSHQSNAMCGTISLYGRAQTAAAWAKKYHTG